MTKRVVTMILVLILILVGTTMYFKKNDANVVNYIDTVKENYDNNQESKENKEIEDQVNEDQIMQFDSKDGIDVGVTFDNIIEEDSDYIVFKLMVNNHRYDLENIKYDELSSLITSDGTVINEGFQWELLGEGGHHISGLLKVPKVYNGNNIITKDTDYIQLELNGIGNAEKMTFKWDREVLNIFNEK